MKAASLLRSGRNSVRPPQSAEESASDPGAAAIGENRVPCPMALLATPRIRWLLEVRLRVFARSQFKTQLSDLVGILVEAAGIEPASAWCPVSASTCVSSVQSRWSQSQKREKFPPWQTWFSPPVAACQRPGTSLLMTPATR